MSIVALAGLLGIGGIFCLFQAFLLIPTELGLAWLQAGVLLLCTCALIFSLDRMLEKVLRRLAATNSPSLDIARKDGPAMTAPVAAPGPLLAAADAPDNDLQGRPLRGAEENDGLFGDSRRVLRADSGSMSAHAQDPRFEREAGQETVDDAMLRTIEQDLYARMPGLPESGDADSDMSLPVGAALPERPGAAGKTGSSPEPKPGLASPFGFSRFRLRNTPAPASAEAEDDVMNAPDAASGEPEPAFPHKPGLIADADLAALETGEQPLAPLETLDIVGAYDSGGTRFTMYSDGSVMAVGGALNQRFPSLDALRLYIDQAGRSPD